MLGRWGVTTPLKGALRDGIFLLFSPAQTPGQIRFDTACRLGPTSHQGSSLGPDDLGTAPDLLVEPLLRVVQPDLGPDGLEIKLEAPGSSHPVSMLQLSLQPREPIVFQLLKVLAKDPLPICWVSFVTGAGTLQPTDLLELGQPVDFD